VPIPSPWPAARHVADRLGPAGLLARPGMRRRRAGSRRPDHHDVFGVPWLVHRLHPGLIGSGKFGRHRDSVTRRQPRASAYPGTLPRRHSTVWCMAFDVARIRGQFPALGDGWIHLDAPAGMQVPEQVATAVSTALRAPVSGPRRVPGLPAGRGDRRRGPPRGRRPGWLRPGRVVLAQRRGPAATPRRRARRWLADRRRGRRVPARPPGEHRTLAARRPAAGATVRWPRSTSRPASCPHGSTRA